MKKPMSAVDRTLRRIDVNHQGCWIFSGAKSEFGYGRVGVGSMLDGTRGHRLTHRVVYEALVGPVADGLQLDHLCRTPACCNPEHLEPVTPRVNNMRGTSVAAVNAVKTHCPAGHEYAGANLGLDKSCKGRVCRACRARDQRERTRARAAREGRSVRPQRPVAVCGTTAGYRRHLRNAEAACPDCLAAKRAEGASHRARTRDRRATA